ncbi:MAG: carbohydrate ABC transporter permease [Rhizobiaceae bacterium]|nr:carbohydrate ABC transporter permease [Rhizobiaceae bacterium]
MREDSARSRFLISLIVWPIILIIVFPFIWMVLTSIKPQTELFRIPPSFWPTRITFEHYATLFEQTSFLKYMRNSIILSTMTTVVVIVIAVLGAYSLTRFIYPGRERIATLVLLTYLLPSVVLVLPLYLMMVRIGVANSLFSLVIAYVSFALPYALWLLRSFMASMPEDLESAALVDGASRLGAFFDIVLPQTLPGIVSTALFTFIAAWNEYFYALILVNTDEARPATTGVISMLVTSFNIEWSLLMAASVAMSLPLIIIFMFLQGFLLRGFAGTGVKG